MKRYDGSSPHQDLAFEKELLQGPPPQEPLLFIYHWKKPVLVLGYAQSASDVDLDEADGCGIEVLRRSSGGTAVLCEESVSLSLFLPNNDEYFLSISRLYGKFLESVRASLLPQLPSVEISTLKEKVSSPICFLSQAGETLTIGGKKFFGGAQARNKNVLMAHGTILLKGAPGLYEKIFHADKMLIKKKITPVELDVGRFKTDATRQFRKWSSI